LDTGPLVAFLIENEPFHPWAKETFRKVRTPFYTCEPVLTEACFLLQRHHAAIQKVGQWLESGLIQLESPLINSSREVFELLIKYRDLPVSLADACLVAMIEAGVGDQVFTLDSDFTIYRLSNRRPVPTLMPNA
jgi:predicted nucleic acid-binding protein